MTKSHQKAKEIPLPQDSPLRKTLPKADYEDAFVRTISNLSSSTSLDGLIQQFKEQVPQLAQKALHLKQWFLSPLGFSPLDLDRFQWMDFGPDSRVGVFSDRPFTAHIGISIDRNRKEVFLSCRVVLHNRMGRLYMFLIKPIHKAAFKFLLNQL